MGTFNKQGSMAKRSRETTKSSSNSNSSGSKSKREKEKSLPTIPTDIPWYDIKTFIDILPSDTKVDNSQLQEKASLIYNKLCASHEKSGKLSSADLEWKENLKNNGTLSDKCANALISAKEASVYQGIGAIKDLMMIATDSRRHRAIPAFETLQEIFSEILPPSRPLLGWKQVKITNENDNVTLAIMHFENMLRRELQNFVKLIDILLLDPLDFVREKSLRALYQLLRASPTFKSIMLSLLCSKLGDGNKKIAAHAARYLESLVKFWNDYEAIILEMEKVLLDRKDSISEKTKYYSTVFLTRLELSRKKPKLIERLLKIYIGLFKQELAIMSKEKDKNSIEKILDGRIIKMISVGLAKAVRYFKGDLKMLKEDLVVPIKRILRNTVSSSTKVQSLILLSSLDRASEDFYGLLSDTLNGFDTGQSACHPRLFAMLYIVISGDGGDNPVTVDKLRDIIKSLLKLILKRGAEKIEFTMASLLFINEAFKLEPKLRDYIKRDAKKGAIDVDTNPKVIKTKKTREITPVIDKEQEQEKKPLAMIAEKENNNNSNSNNDFWELAILKRHYHPMISGAAHELLLGSPLSEKYMVRPFEVLTMTQFFDKLQSLKFENLIKTKNIE